jgi:hypothetical protein
MTLKRIGALLVAVALVVGAILIRKAIGDDSSDSQQSDGGSSNGAYSLICSTEFTDICGQLPDSYAVTVEPAGVTLDRLATAQSSELPDAWLTLDPFPAMLDEIRSRASNLPPSVKTTAPVATTEQVFALPADRAAAFQRECDTDPVGRCVGDLAGRKWSDLGATDVDGRVKPAINDPDNEAFGLLTFANAVAGYHDRTSIDSTAWSGDSAFTSWLRNFVNNVGIIAGSTLNTMLVRESSVDVAATSTAEISTTPRASEDGVTTLPASPGFGTNATLATFGEDRDEVAEILTTLLVGQGWERPAADEAPLPASTFIALRQLWKDTT